MNDAATKITFLPYVRRGLVQALETADPLSGPLSGSPEVTAWVTVKGSPVSRAVTLRRPGEAVALGPVQVVRREPQPDAIEVERNNFPFVELRSPDLPWLLTPAAPASHGRLRPWLILVVVAEQDGVRLGPRPGALLPVLTIASPAVPAAELPDLDDSWAWVHVQSLVSADAVPGAVDAQSDDVIARLICPRRLEPTTSYHACIVPAFEDGRLRGLGQPLPGGAEIAAAWTVSAMGDAIDLPVYDSWRFTTGEAGDFESLCRRLVPDGDGAVLGLHSLDVSAPGILDPSAHAVVLDMEGALMTSDAVGRDWAEADRRAFQAELIPLLDAGIQRIEYDPSNADPVVSPPTYGAWPAGVSAVPDKGWVRTLNANPVRRAAAGLGARIVQANQEALVAAAWANAGELRETIGVLNRARLATEVTRSLATRTATLSDGDLLRLTGRLQPLLPGGAESISARIASSAAPSGLVSAAVVRLTRPGTPLARSYGELTGRCSGRLGAEHLATTIAATGRGDESAGLQAALTFALHGIPRGAQTTDPTLEEEVVSGWRVGRTPARASEQVRSLGERYGTAVERPQEIGSAAGALPRVTPPPKEDISGIAGSVRERLDPVGALRSDVIARVPALAELLGRRKLPTTVPLGPTFEDPLAWDLIALGAEWLMPGVSNFGANRIRLVDVNPTFVGALIVGANHEIARELAWRGYPVDPRATFFQRFWQYVEPTRVDIDDIATTWAADAPIADNVAIDPGSLTAIVVRGDLVRRYPTAHWFLQQAAPAGHGLLGPVEGTMAEVAFLAALDAETAVFGFDVPVDVVRGDDGGHGYFVGVEEQPAGPRFGLDVEAAADFKGKPGSWDECSWGHLVANQKQLDALTHATATGSRLDGLSLDGATWGRNAAHQARATWQRPFRMLIHAERLI